MSNSLPSDQIEGHVGDHSRGIAIGTNITQVNIYAAPQSAEAAFDAIAMEERYCRQVIKQYNKLPLAGLPERDPGLHELTLEHIFVKLNVTIQSSIGFAREVEHWRLEEEARQPQPNLRSDDDQRRRVELRRLEHEAIQPKIISLSIAEALHQHKRLVILGGPGSGKTTLTRWLAVIFADGRQGQPETLGANFTTPRLPLIVELRRFAERYIKLGEAPTVPDLAAELTSFISNHAYYPETPPAFIQQVLAAGRCLLLFDGLDEIADLGARQLLIQSIQAFLNHPQHSYGENLCLVTSRPYGYQSVSLGAGFQESEVKPFTPDDVKLFITHWYDSAYGDQDEAQRLLDAIGENQGVADLATNPLLCTIVAVVYRNNRVLPNRRVELYLKCCEALLDTWERNKAIRDSGLIGGYDWQTKLELLAPVAYWLHSERERLAATEDEYVRQLAKVLQEKGLADGVLANQEARRFITLIRDRSGLLQGRGDGTLEFMHRTFQEYLAARHIAAQPDPDYIDLVMEHLHEAWWQEVHLLVIESLYFSAVVRDKADRLLQTIVKSYRPPFFIFHASAIAASISHLLLKKSARFDKGINSFKIPALFFLLPLLLTRNTVALLFPRFQLARRLAWILRREIVFSVEAYLRCEYVGTKPHIKKYLSDLSATAILWFVYNGYGKELENPQLRPLFQIQQGLHGSLLIGQLLPALNSSQPEICAAAATALQHFDHIPQPVLDALLQLLNDSENIVREAAIHSLGRLQQFTPAVVTALYETLINAEHDIVRDAAILALAQLAQHSPEVVEFLLKKLTPHPYHSNFLSVAVDLVLQQLAPITPSVIDALQQALTAPEWKVRIAAAHVLIQLDDVPTKAIDILHEGLAKTSVYTRAAAAHSLGKMFQIPSLVAETLDKMLADPSWRVRIEVAYAQVTLGLATSNTIEVFHQALDVLPQSVELIKAASGLVQLNRVTSKVTDVLVDALIYSEDVRYSIALDAVNKLSPDAAQIIVSTLHQQFANFYSRGLRSAKIVTTLGKIGKFSPDYVDILLTIGLYNSEASIRSAAAYALGKIGGDSTTVLETLCKTLNDSDELVRVSAADALSQLEIHNEIQLQQVLAQLNRSVHALDYDIRGAALAAIRSLVNGRPLPGYRWVPLRQQREQSRRHKAALYWSALAITLFLIALGLTYLDKENRLIQRLLTLGGLIGIAAALAQVVGKRLHNSWEKEDQSW